jgi:lipoprotein-anchoring transpeptidase ErfK/SrfK
VGSTTLLAEGRERVRDGRRSFMRWLGAAVCLSLAGTACGTAKRHVVATAPRPPVTTTVATTTSTSVPAPSSVVAQALVPHLLVYSSPGAPSPSQTLANPRPLGGTLALLVTAEQPGWVQALLPVRPNGTMGWVRDSDVKLTTHDFRIVVELKAHHITVYHGYDVIDSEPIAVGSGATPTPGGIFYTEDFVRADPRGPYGPYAYGLSGFSDVLKSFGGGPGQLAIHGTNQAQFLGSDVSHGCIRMSNAGITRLAAILPIGVPVQVLA